jgi:hypothetical protein
MPALFARPRKRFSWLALLGMLCIALVLASGIAQVAHNHASGQPDHDCSLCVSAHNVIQIAAAVALVLSGVAVGAVAVEPVSILPRRHFFFQLWSRPPPADPAFA